MAGLLVALVFGIFWVLGRKAGSDSGPGNFGPPKGIGESLRDLVKDERDLAHDQLLIEKAKRDSKVEEDRKVLEQIAKEPDREIRRRKMSNWLTDNI